MKNKRLLTVFLIFTFLVGCKHEEVIPVKIETENEIVEIKTFITETEFTKEENIYLKNLMEIKKLKIATREENSVYEVDENGTAGGFNFLLLEEFAKEINVDIEITLVEFSDYFKINGIVPEIVKTDPNYSYTPDLINDVDIYCDIITIIPWREKLFKFIEILPVRQMAITRTGEEIKGIIELKDKVIALKPDTSYESRLWEIEQDLGLTFMYYFVDGPRVQQKAVSNGLADVSIQDSNVAINELKKYDNLSISIPIADVQNQGWAVKKENLELASILEKYIRYAEKTGLMDNLWTDEYGITLLEYLKLLD